MKNIYWKPWLKEAQVVINSYARFVFAALVLTALVLLNVAAIVTTFAQMRLLISGCH